MSTIPTKSASYDPESIKFFHNLSCFCFGNKLFPVLSSFRALLARLPKRKKRKVVSGSRVTPPVNFACKTELSFSPLAKVTLAVGLPYLLVIRALHFEHSTPSNIHCSYSSVCLPVFAHYLLVSFNPSVILFCSASKRQGNISKIARFIYPLARLQTHLFPKLL